MKKILFIILALGLFGAYLYFRSFVSSPKYSLLQAKEAAQNHNMAEFEKYVNVESLTGSLVDQVTEQQGLIGSFIPGLRIPEGIMDYLKPSLAKAARNEVKNYVETGQVNMSTSNAPLFSLAAVVGALVSDDSQFKGIAYTKEDGEQALVGLEFTQPTFDTTLVVEIKMLDKGNYWQATELTNAGELLRHVARLEKEHQPGH